MCILVFSLITNTDWFKHRYTVIQKQKCNCDDNIDFYISYVWSNWPPLPTPTWFTLFVPAIGSFILYLSCVADHHSMTCIDVDSCLADCRWCQGFVELLRINSDSSRIGLSIQYSIRWYYCGVSYINPYNQISRLMRSNLQGDSIGVTIKSMSRWTWLISMKSH